MIETQSSRVNILIFESPLSKSCTLKPAHVLEPGRDRATFAPRLPPRLVSPSPCLGSRARPTPGGGEASRCTTFGEGHPPARAGHEKTCNWASFDMAPRPSPSWFVLNLTKGRCVFVSRGGFPRKKKKKNSSPSFSTDGGATLTRLAIPRLPGFVARMWEDCWYGTGFHVSPSRPFRITHLGAGGEKKGSLTKEDQRKQGSFPTRPSPQGRPPSLLRPRFF